MLLSGDFLFPCARHRFSEDHGNSQSQSKPPAEACFHTSEEMNDGQEFKPPPMRENTLVLFPYSPSMLCHIPKCTHEACRTACGHGPIGSCVLSASVSISMDAMLQEARMPTRVAGQTGLQVVPHATFNQWRNHLCMTFRKGACSSCQMPGFLDSVGDE